MGNDHEGSARLGMPAGAAVLENPAHAKTPDLVLPLASLERTFEHIGSAAHTLSYTKRTFTVSFGLWDHSQSTLHPAQSATSGSVQRSRQTAAQALEHSAQPSQQKQSGGAGIWSSSKTPASPVQPWTGQDYRQHLPYSTAARRTSSALPSLTASAARSTRAQPSSNGHRSAAGRSWPWTSALTCPPRQVRWWRASCSAQHSMSAASLVSEPRMHWPSRRRQASVSGVLKSSLTQLSSASSLNAQEAAHCLPSLQGLKLTASAQHAVAPGGIQVPSRLSSSHNGPTLSAHRFTREVAA